MNRKREAIFMGIGILAGLALCGPATHAADYLTARSSTQTFYINGQQTALTAYSISSSNYVRLRDIGRAVDFGVTYDAATNSVHIDPNAPYVEAVTIPAPTTPSPQIVTEECVQAALAQLKQTYPIPTVPPAAGPTTGEPIAPAGPRCVRMPPSVIFHGGGSTAQTGSSSDPATWWSIKTASLTMWWLWWARRTSISKSPREAQTTKSAGAGSTSADGWRSSPITSATPGTCNSVCPVDSPGAAPEPFPICPPL